MGTKEVKLVFDRKTGKVRKEVNGFTSTECVSKTKFIDDAIGTVEKTEYKTEYHLPNPQGLDAEARVYT
jgi:hypothetical protein